MAILAPIPVGDWIDRMTILEIKLVAIRDPTKRANVRRELTALKAVAPPDLIGNAELARLRAELKAVNEELWRIEDEIRVCERAAVFDARFIALARAVYLTNDRRATLKREISGLADSSLIEEKSYASTSDRV